jgi:hypothetical protein
MRVSSLKFFLVLLIALPHFAWAQAAVVRMLRGQAVQVSDGKEVALKPDDQVSVGTKIRTLDKSFLRLAFTDKTQINLGPNSEMVVERFGGGDSGIINVIKGKIRATVSKDYLEMREKQRSKLFIKSPEAVLGVRGTDFMLSVGASASSTVLFEGEIAFARNEAGSVTPADLEAVVERGVRLFPGEFSVQDGQKSSPTVPSLLNVGQLEKLEQNNTFNAERSPSSAVESTSASIVPAGLSGTLAANSEESLSTAIAGIVPTVPGETGRVSEAQGFVSGDQVKPTNGSFLHVESGVVIPPPADAIFDSTTNTFMASSTNGGVSEDGSYVPPKNMEITPDGKITVTSVGENGKVSRVEVAPPPPVTSLASSSFGAPVASASAPQWNPALDRPAPSGGLQGINDPQRASGNFTDVIFRAP